MTVPDYAVQTLCLCHVQNHGSSSLTLLAYLKTIFQAFQPADETVYSIAEQVHEWYEEYWEQRLMALGACLRTILEVFQTADDEFYPIAEQVYEWYEELLHE